MQCYNEAVFSVLPPVLPPAAHPLRPAAEPRRARAARHSALHPPAQADGFHKDRTGEMWQISWLTRHTYVTIHTL